MLICQKDSLPLRCQRHFRGNRLSKENRCRLIRRRGLHNAEARGDGLAFMHAGGTIVKKDLQPGETLMLDTGCLGRHDSKYKL